MNSPPITASAPAPITQVGTTTRAGRYGAVHALPVRRQRRIGGLPLAHDDRCRGPRAADRVRPGRAATAGTGRWKPRLRQRYISSSTGRNVPGLLPSWLSRSKKRSPLRTSWWKVETSERAAQAPLLPQGVFSTTSSRLAHSA